MIPQVKCSLLVRGLKKNCERICEEMDFEKESIEKDTNHYRMICSAYFPCDMSLDFSFDDLAAEFSVDITYLFSEIADQVCEYDVDYNLDDFLTNNGLSVNGTAYGFGKDAGASDDISILNGSTENANKPHKATKKTVAKVESWNLFDNIDRNDSRWIDWINWVLKELSEYNAGLEMVDRDTYVKIMQSVTPGSKSRNFALNYPSVYLKAEEGDELARRFVSICNDNSDILGSLF